MRTKWAFVLYFCVILSLFEKYNNETLKKHNLFRMCLVRVLLTTEPDGRTWMPVVSEIDERGGGGSRGRGRRETGRKMVDC